MASHILPFRLKPIHKLTRHLYGVRVPAVHYAAIKLIADLLVGNTLTREELRYARGRCAEIARRAWKSAGAA